MSQRATDANQVELKLKSVKIRISFKGSLHGFFSSIPGKLLMSRIRIRALNLFFGNFKPPFRCQKKTLKTQLFWTFSSYGGGFRISKKRF